MADVGCVVVATVVARRLGYELDDVLGQSRSSGVARARHLAMAVARSTLGRSYHELGRAFSRDHTSVVHAVQSVTRRVSDSTDEAQTFLGLREAAERALEAEFGVSRCSSEHGS